MAEKMEKWYPGEGKLTPGCAILYVILVLGLISAIGPALLWAGRHHQPE